MSHYVTIEIIHHFTCIECKNTWSIATMSNNYRAKALSCPFCKKLDYIGYPEQQTAGIRE